MVSQLVARLRWAVTVVFRVVAGVFQQCIASYFILGSLQGVARWLQWLSQVVAVMF